MGKKPIVRHSYFLFDKNSNLVDESIKRPSEKEALYVQIENYLSK